MQAGGIEVYLLMQAWGCTCVQVRTSQCRHVGMGITISENHRRAPER